MKNNVKFITLGCKVNQAESESLASYACGDKTISLPEDKPTDICIINTCAVTGKAAMQSRQAIRKAVRAHPGAKIIVTGCYAQTEPEQIRHIKGVDYIIGQSDKHRIFDIIGTDSPEKCDAPTIINEPIGEKRLFARMPSPAAGSRTRPFLKIQDGCNSFCTYCIVPYSRGRSRSLSPDQVLIELDALIRTGAREIVLTGIHLGRWGLDLPGKHNLTRLLEQILAQPDLNRLRLSSLEPTEITAPLLDLIGNSPKICRHFHIPLQSGDPGVLKRMNRHYSPKDFAETVKSINRYFEEAAIGADLLTGFPGETNREFQNTYDFIKSLPVSYLHVFPFSPRPPAPAANYPDHVPPGIIKQRALALSELGRSKKETFYQKMTGRILEVITEKEVVTEKKTNQSEFCVKGLSSNYIPVYIQGCEAIEINQVVDCLVTKSDQDRSVSGIICGNNHMIKAETT